MRTSRKHWIFLGLVTDIYLCLSTSIMQDIQLYAYGICPYIDTYKVLTSDVLLLAVSSSEIRCFLHSVLIAKFKQLMQRTVKTDSLMQGVHYRC